MKLKPRKARWTAIVQSYVWSLSFESHGVCVLTKSAPAETNNVVFQVSSAGVDCPFLKRQRHETKVELYKGTKVDGFKEDTEWTKIEGENIKK